MIDSSNFLMIMYWSTSLMHDDVPLFSYWMDYNKVCFTKLNTVLQN
jgi:hypothetical protein